MRRRPLGRSMLDASVLGLGALHFGVYLDEAETARLVGRAIDLGVTFFDTSPLYGRGQSEGFLGRAVAGRRDGLILSTKVGMLPRTREDGSFGCDIDPLTAPSMRASVERSLRALGTDTIDLLQIHAFDPDTPLEETFGALARLVEEGKIRAVGCSNYSDEELAVTVPAVAGLPFVSVQCHYNLMERRAGDRLAPLCRRHGYGLVCNRALARGILGGRYQPDAPPPPDSRGADSPRVRRWLEPELLRLVQDLDAFARDHGRSVAELAVAWLAAQDMVAVVLAGVRTPAQLDAAVRAATWALSPDDLAEVNRIIGQHGLTQRVQELPEVFFEK